MEKTEAVPVLPVRLPRDLRDWLRAEAARNCRSMNMEVLARLRRDRDSQTGRVAA